MTAPPDETPDTPGTLPTLTPTASSPARGLRSFNRRIGALLALLLIALVLREVLFPGSPESRAASEITSRTLEALRITKLAYNDRVEASRHPVLTRPRNARPSPDAQTRLEDAALAKWRALANDPNALPGDWRRYGLALAAFERPGALQALRHVADPPHPTRKPKADAAGTTTSPKSLMPPLQEVALWEAIFGPQPLPASRANELRPQLARLKLRWFEPIAAARLYTKAGLRSEAAREEAAAYAGTTLLVALSNWQSLALLIGLCVLMALLLRALRRLPRLFRSTISSHPPISSPPVEQDNAVLPPPDYRRGRGQFGWSPPLPELVRERGPGGMGSASAIGEGYSARMVAFLAYMGLPVLLNLPLLGLRSQVKNWSPVALARFNVLLYLTVSVLLVAVVLAILRRRGAAESPTGHQPSLREILSTLGWRSHNPRTDIGVGLLGHTALMPLLLLATVLSDWLFHRFSSPPHPVLITTIVMTSPLDRLLVLLETAVTAPLVEETMFRGLLYPALRARWGVVRGIVLSAAIFAIVHPNLPAGFLPIWVLGAVFALTYEWRGSLLPGVLMHALNNGLLILSQFATLSS